MATDADTEKGLVPNKCATMCLFGCLTVIGCRSSVVRRLAFYPPQPAGYSISSDNQLYIFDGTPGQQQPTSRSAPPPDVVSASGVASAQGGSAASGDLQRESIQHLLRRTGLPERVEVLKIPCGRKESLAGLFLYHPLNPPSIGSHNNTNTTSGSTPETQSGQPSTAHTPETPRAEGHRGPGSAGPENSVMIESARRLPCIIFSHGNSTDIGYMFGLYYRLAYRCRVNVLAYDYSGYGCSDGNTTEKALYRNIRAVWSYAVNNLKIPPHHLIVYGHSVGSAPCCDLAMREKTYPVGGVVLHSSLASGLRLFIEDINKSPWFDAFPNVDKLKKVKQTPILIIHGQLDRQISWTHSQRLEAAAHFADEQWYKEQQKQQLKAGCRKPGSRRVNGSPSAHSVATEEMQAQRVQTWWVGNADHNDVEQKSGEAYYRRISDFVSFCTLWAAAHHDGVM
ncbi:alpha beta hydrolase family protein [Cystoisospora suis]|uniref:Alpha beta hydrolase family protein n=1 Tax=Cystoisospora suis TaxID=483139 RepID=A0A2C6LCG1_9APIC|nr:alpha beta hydrolase family protein [Cystoisospora suis]